MYTPPDTCLTYVPSKITPYTINTYGVISIVIAALGLLSSDYACGEQGSAE